MTSFLDKSSFAAIFVVLALMPFVSHAGGLGVAPLVFILGILGIILAVKTQRFKITNVQIALIAFLTWLSFTALWSPYRPDDLLTNYLKLFLMVMVFYWSWPLFEYTGRRRPRRLQHLVMSAMFFTAGLVVIDLLSDFGLTLLFNPAIGLDETIRKIIDAEMNLGHSITILIVLAAPTVCLMKERLRKEISVPLGTLFLFLILWAAWLNGLTVGILGLVSVMFVATLAYIFPRTMPRIILSLAIVSILLAPLLAFLASNYVPLIDQHFPLSWEHRLRMWGYCWQVIAEHPIRGAGFDASRSFSDTFVSKITGNDILIVSLHPHNVGIQIWTEAGFIGALLASAVLVTLFKPIDSFTKTRSHSAALSGVIVAIIVISSLTYGAWQFWWWGCVFLAIGTLHLIPDSQNQSMLQDNQWVS